jgi:hypothetical protein
MQSVVSFALPGDYTAVRPKALLENRCLKCAPKQVPVASCHCSDPGAGKGNNGAGDTDPLGQPQQNGYRSSQNFRLINLNFVALIFVERTNAIFIGEMGRHHGNSAAAREWILESLALRVTIKRHPAGRRSVRRGGVLGTPPFG